MGSFGLQGLAGALAVAAALAAAACGGSSGSPSSSGSPDGSTSVDGGNNTPVTVTVVGKVLAYDGRAGAFLPVMVNGAKTSTDGSGNFSLGDVTAPYELVVLDATQKTAYVYQGLTRPNPIVLVFLAPSSTTTRTATITWSFTNFTTTAPPAGQFADGQLGCAGSEVSVNCGVSGSVGTAPYDDTVNWAGPQSFRTTFYALQAYKSSRNVVTTFNRFGRYDGQVTEGQKNAAPIAFQAITSKVLGGTISVAPGSTLVNRTLGFVASGEQLYPFSFESEPTVGIAPSFTWASPVVVGLDLCLTATSKKGDASVHATLAPVAPDNTAISLALPAPVEPVEPAANAVGVTGATTFAWSTFAGGTYSVSIAPSVPGPLSYAIYTDRTDAKLPDLSSLGYPLPKGVAFRWSVSAQAPATVDSLLQGVALRQAAQSSYSGQRPFTTAP